jgi:hypothetical protein
LEALEASAKIIITNSPKVLGSDSDRHQIRIQVSYYFLFVFRVAKTEFFKCSKDEGFLRTYTNNYTDLWAHFDLRIVQVLDQPRPQVSVELRITRIVYLAMVLQGSEVPGVREIRAIIFDSRK